MGTLNTAVGTPPAGTGGGGGGEGTTDHAALSNRSAASQHPQSAITGLVSDLEAIVAAISSAITTAQARGDHTGTQLAATISDLDSAVNTLIAAAGREKAWTTEMVTGTTLTLAAIDDRKTFIFTNAGAIAVGVPTAASGIRCQFVWAGNTGRITVTPSSTNVNGAATAIDLSDAAGCAELIPTGTANDWTLSGAIGNLSPADITGNTFAICATFPEGADETFVLCQYAPFPFTINSSVSDCDGGTATYRVQIEGVNVGSTANAVSTTEETQAHSSANTVALGNTVQLVKSANAACVMGRVTLVCTRTG